MNRVFQIATLVEPVQFEIRPLLVVGIGQQRLEPVGLLRAASRIREALQALGAALRWAAVKGLAATPAWHRWLPRVDPLQRVDRPRHRVALGILAG